uniref:Uncharacterized protein n=1 Tax=Arundo donax TaxID=35708 RepID=A0A0A9HBW9_ARUDO
MDYTLPFCLSMIHCKGPLYKHLIMKALKDDRKNIKATTGNGPSKKKSNSHNHM